MASAARVINLADHRPKPIEHSALHPAAMPKGVRGMGYVFVTDDNEIVFGMLGADSLNVIQGLGELTASVSRRLVYSDEEELH